MRRGQNKTSSDTLTVVNRGRCQDRGRYNNRRRSKSARRSKSRGRNGDCWFYGKASHTKKNRWLYKKEQETLNDSEANTAYDKDEYVLVLSTSDTTADSWVLDSGDSFHASPCREVFINYQEGQFGRIYLDDNKACEIIGKGDMMLQLKNGNKWILRDVRHVPTLKRNLIFVGSFMLKGVMSISP